MPTNKERREIAEYLRNMCIYGCSYKEEFYDLLVDNVMDELYDPEFSDVADRLAELIEPEERTCRIEPLSLNEFFAGEKYTLSRRARESAKDERFGLLSREIEKDARFMCSNCHVLFGTREAANADYYILEDGTYEVDTFAPLIKFCPNCGAKVVE